MKRILLSLGGVALSLLIAAPAAAAKGKTTKCIEGAGCIVNECTTGTCKSGECVRWKPDNSKCNDKNECTKDVCTEKRGCLHTNQPEGTPCAADKNACTIDKCNHQGKCKTVETKKCDDDKFCTTDTCDPAEGTCKFTKNPDPGCCEPGTQDKAGKDDACKVGITCTQDGTWPSPVWSTNGTSCDDTDQNACTAATCSGGGCNQSGRIKTACNPTRDGCCPAGCNTSANNLDPDCSASCGNFIREGDEKCDGSITDATCGPNQYGLDATGCDTSLCTCIYPPGECQPGQTQNVGTSPCTGVKTCDSTGHWGTASYATTNGYSCTGDNNSCTDDKCSAGSCIHPNKAPGAACTPDNNACTADVCNASGQCTHNFNSQLCQCQPGAVQPADSAYPCDVESVCINGQWVKDFAKNSNTVCRIKQGDCDVEEKCDGATSTCPADAVRSAGEVCRLATAGDPCDLPETCDGASAACPQEDLRRRDYTFDQTLTARPLAEAATGIEAPAQTLTNYRTLSDYQMFNIVPQDISPKTLSQFSPSTATRQTSAPRLSVVAPLTAELIAQAIARANDRCTIRSCNADGRYAETPRDCAATSDGCCPAGCNTNTDDDCTADCGNGVVEDGEVCDQGITSQGAPGRCPATSADCTDNLPYTIDSVSDINSCNATCTHVTDTSHCYIPQGDGTSSEVSIGAINDQNRCEICRPAANQTGWTPRQAGPIAQPIDRCHTAETCDGAGHLVAGGWIQAAAGDGCCNPADGANDADCALCGNMELDPGEDCEKSITSGSGACPLSCDDQDPTTKDELKEAGSCKAYCTHKVEKCSIAGTSTPGQYVPYMQDYIPGYTPGGTSPAAGQGQLYDPGQVNPTNPCEICDLASPKKWSPVPEKTPCGGDPCKPKYCSQGVCLEKPIACADDACHKGGMCDSITGACVYAETTECPAPETAVCDGAKLDPGEFCDGAFGCGADQTCAECKKCVDKEQVPAVAAAPSVAPKCSVLGASPEVAKRNEELVGAGIDNVCFCESETSTCCMVFAVSQPKGTTAATASAAAGAWQLNQLSGRTLASSDPTPKGIQAPVMIFKSAPATTAPGDPLDGLSTGIPGATLDRVGDDHVVINNMLSYAKVPIGPQGGGEFAPPTSKEVLKVTSSASASPAMQTTGETVCFVAPLQPTWLQADGAGGEDSNWDMSKMSERIKQAQTAKKAAGVAASAAPPDLGNTGGLWNPHDVYQFSFSLATAGAQQVAPNIEGSAKASTAWATATFSAGVTILATPGYSPGHADKPGCGLVGDAAAPSVAGVFLVIVGALLLAPAGALVAVRVRERRRK